MKRVVIIASVLVILGIIGLILQNPYLVKERESDIGHTTIERLDGIVNDRIIRCEIDGQGCEGWAYSMLEICKSEPKYKDVPSCNDGRMERLIGDTNFFLYVSDQSFAISPVDITVFIDGELVITGNFTEGMNQHKHELFSFSLSNGTHTIMVNSVLGDANFEEEFEINGTRWADLDYFYYPDKPDNRKLFDFSVSKEPIRFR